MPITVSGTTITFNDATTQTTAGITSAVTSLNGSTGAITNTGFNNIGSYSAGGGGTSTSTWAPGSTISGSSITQGTNDNCSPFGSFQTNAGSRANQGQTGTWRAMGRSSWTDVGDGYIAVGSNLWVRIS
jgi:hypothetical protein